MVNPWLQHVKDYAAKNNVPYNKAISLARASYKKGAKDEPKAMMTRPKKNKNMSENMEQKRPRRNAKGQYQ